MLLLSRLTFLAGKAASTGRKREEILVGMMVYFLVEGLLSC